MRHASKELCKFPGSTTLRRLHGGLRSRSSSASFRHRCGKGASLSPERRTHCRGVLTARIVNQTNGTARGSSRCCKRSPIRSKLDCCGGATYSQDTTGTTPGAFNPWSVKRSPPDRPAIAGIFLPRRRSLISWTSLGATLPVTHDDREGRRRTRWEEKAAGIMRTWRLHEKSRDQVSIGPRSSMGETFGRK
ncbi:hypothetical protein HPP92_003810 [Vanilla planifolia]|uniref:Uncharacterized protein n=1 Tax=Vanilla planifolia TaxID=51239 RepID=A0A835VNW1_VANPL|nr:hypothetical protein HPP92_003810 [Vanilla planifolia]